MIAIVAMSVGGIIFVGFVAGLVNFRISSATDDLRCPSSSAYTARHRAARRMAGVVVVRSGEQE